MRDFFMSKIVLESLFALSRAGSRARVLSQEAGQGLQKRSDNFLLSPPARRYFLCDSSFVRGGSDGFHPGDAEADLILHISRETGVNEESTVFLARARWGGRGRPSRTRPGGRIFS